MTNAHVFLNLAVVPFGRGSCSAFAGLILMCAGAAAILAYLMFLGVLILRPERTPWRRLRAALRIVAFRFLLETIAWLLGLVIFTVVSLVFSDSPDFGFLLVPFFLTMYAMRTYAWWVVGGRGLPSLSKHLHVVGMELGSKSHFAWATVGVLLTILSDIGIFAGSGVGADFLDIWRAPY